MWTIDFNKVFAEFDRGMQRITDRLDKIIVLLELIATKEPHDQGSNLGETK